MERAAAVQHKLWRGRVPVLFSLHVADVTTLHAPRPFYAMVPRMGYLVAQTRSVIEYFRDAAPPIAGLAGNTVWFESGCRALKWHLPVGVLFDLSQHAHGHGDSERHHEEALPWRVVVHFSGFPSDQLLPCEKEQTAEVHFMHTLKQATFLRSGSTKIIMGMPEAQQTQIWTSVTQNDLASYHTATRDLQLATAAPTSRSGERAIRFIPLRLYVGDEPVLQMPVSPIVASVPDTACGDGGKNRFEQAVSKPRDNTLGDVLRTLLPDLFLAADEGIVTRPAKATPRVVLHGIVVPLHLALLPLYECFAYADGFLHIAIIAVL